MQSSSPPLFRTRCKQGTLLLTDTAIIVQLGSLRSETMLRTALTNLESKVAVPPVFGKGGGTNLIFSGQGGTTLHADLVPPRDAEMIQAMLRSSGFAAQQPAASFPPASYAPPSPFLGERGSFAPPPYAQPAPFATQPPPAPPFAPPPAPFPGPRSSGPRRGPRRLFLVIGAVAVLLVIVIVITAIATTASPPPQTQATPQATQAQVTKPVATAKPKPTSKPASGLAATHGTPRLGGPLSDFVGAYGQPNNHSNPPIDYHFQRASNGVQDNLIVDLATDNSLVDFITVATLDPGWTATEAQDKCMAYAPTDAHFKQRIDYTDGSGYDLVYISTSLAHQFPAGDFTDANSSTVPAGTFDVSYLYASDGQHIGGCDLIIGEQQTQ